MPTRVAIVVIGYREDDASALSPIEEHDDRHDRAVPDVHDSVTHPSSSRAAVAVKSITAKFRPVHVIVTPPVVGKLRMAGTSVRTGASKLNATMLVPTCDAIVTTPRDVRLSLPDRARSLEVGPTLHRSAVVELQCVVEQESKRTTALGVASASAKLMPCNVIDTLDEAGPFAMIKLVSTAASNVKPEPKRVDEVPTIAAIVTLVRTAKKTSGGLAVQLRLVVDVHPVVRHARCWSADDGV